MSKKITFETDKKNEMCFSEDMTKERKIEWLKENEKNALEYEKELSIQEKDMELIALVSHELNEVSKIGIKFFEDMKAITTKYEDALNKFSKYRTLTKYIEEEMFEEVPYREGVLNITRETDKNFDILETHMAALQ